MKPKRSWALLALASLLAAAPVRAENIRITVLHTNDIHGWAMSQPDRNEKEKRVGGAAAYANFVKSYREKGPVLLVDGGDWFQGTPEGAIPGGKMMADIFNVLKLDATVVGNHDYDLGQGTLKALIARMDAPVLGANVISRATGKPIEYVKPYILKEIAGVKIGIFGLNTSNMRALSFETNIAGIDFQNESETARKIVAELKEKGADVIILLSHAGFEGSSRHMTVVGDQTIAKNVPGIDLIVGAHTHKAIYNPEHVNGALIVQTRGYLSQGGVVTLEVDRETRKVVSSGGELVELAVEKWGEDPAMSELVEGYEHEVGRQLGEEIGSAAETLRRSYKEEDAVGGWMSDCMRKWTKTDVVIQNGGGVRADIKEGPLTLRHMFELMPFDNYIVTVNMPGKAVLGLFDHGVSGEIGMIEVSGARLRYVPGAPAGERIAKATIGGRELDPEAIYSVTAPDFIVQGGDNYDFSAARDNAATPTLIRDVLTWCTRGYSPVRAEPLDRVVRN